MGPKSQAVYEEIRRRVVERELSPGDKLPSERALSEELDIGRTALRQVLAQLVREGLLERHQRSAYRVPRAHLEGSLGLPDALLENLRDQHGLTDEGLQLVLSKAQLRLVEKEGGKWWAVEYRVSLD